MGQSAFVTIRSLIPQLKLRTADPNIEGMLPDMADMVRFVEENVGLTSENTPVKTIRLDVVGHKAKLPPDFYKIADEGGCGVVRGEGFPKDFFGIDVAGGYNNGEGTGDYHKPLYEDYTVEGCWLKTPHHKGGVVHLRYFSLPIDSENIPMIKKGHEEAFMAYIVMIRQQTRYMQREIQYYEKEKDLQYFQQQCGFARGKDNNPSRRRLSQAGQINNDPYKQSRNYGGGNRGGFFNS